MEDNQSQNVKDQVSTNNEVSEKSSRIIISMQDHPLMNILILDNIIRHLDYNDLKNFRLVCQRWKAVAENVYRKLTIINVRCSFILENELEKRALEIAKKNRKLTDSFESTFPSPAGLPTNAILFERYISRRTLEYFWKERGSFTLTSVYFRFFRAPTKESIDLKNFITPKLATLNIGFSLENKFTVSFKMLANIQNLSLCRCEIILDGRIAPKKLDLKDCSLSYKGKLYIPGDPGNRNAQRILINEFVDLSKIKKLILHNIFWKLDVSRDTKELEHLALRNIELGGLRNSQWKTNFVDIGKCICIGDKMKINSILGEVAPFDLESLPNIVEHLWFRIYGSNFRLPQPLIFEYPKLKSLTILMFIPLGIRIFDFTNCSSLVDFQFSHFISDYETDFSQIILPNSIRNVKFNNLIPNADAPWQLDTLVLCNYPISAVERALHHFTTAKFVIQLKSQIKLKREDLMIIINHWRNSSIEHLALRYCGMDGRIRFSLFNNKSKLAEEAIDSDRFGKLSNLNLHKDLLPYMISF